MKFDWQTIMQLFWLVAIIVSLFVMFREMDQNSREECQTNIEQCKANADNVPANAAMLLLLYAI